MSWFSKPDIATLLNRERPLLDQIFGAGAYEIEGDSDPHGAIVRSGRLDLHVWHDNTRDCSMESSLKVTEPWGEWEDGPFVWVRFLDEKIPPLPRNRTGHVVLSREEQIHAELKWVARVSAEIFSDPEKTRDAFNFASGYRAAYNDRYDGAWDD